MARTVERWVSLATSFVTGCTSCVGYWGKEDGYVSLDGFRSDPDELMMTLDVPERLRSDVLSETRCGECGNSIADESEIWVWSEAEVEFRARVARARERYEPRLSEFRDFLAKHPYLGATHKTGRALIGAVRKAEGIRVGGRWWRCIKERATTLVPDDFRAPHEEQEHPIHEGRFNHAGQPHWYLADSLDTGIAEVLDGEPGVVFAQQFELEQVENVLDLWIPHDQEPVSSLDGSLMALALVLSHANLYERVERRKAWKPGYLLPRFIMDAAKRAGFAGVRYSSVRAFQGANLVLFNREAPAKFVGAIERHEFEPHYGGPPFDPEDSPF